MKKALVLLILLVAVLNATGRRSRRYTIEYPAGWSRTIMAEAEEPAEIEEQAKSEEPAEEREEEHERGKHNKAGTVCKEGR